MIERIILILDFVFFLWIFLGVVYLLLFALYTQKKKPNPYPQARIQHPILVLFPAYKEDKVIVESVRSFLQQDYPAALYQVTVISDGMKEETNDYLRAFPVTVLNARFEKSSKAAALNLAMETHQGQAYDIVAILDADNIAAPDFLQKINDAFDFGIQAIQVHRVSKEVTTDVSVLDRTSEEINNSIFREGHVRAGLSSALIGSGMAFDYDWFARHIPRVTSAGEDKELELLLLKDNVYVDYLSDVYVYDEKISSATAFYRQRRRWIAAQFDLLGKGVRYLPQAIFTGNLDYCDKIYQWLLPPRIVLAGFTFLVGVAWIIFDWTLSLKWWMTFFLLLCALSLAMPDKLYDASFKKALRKLPVLFLL
ncbi:MAG: glycosyltransferase family 2 protein, partial [Desulfitobacteriaceae bacterium]|nr:glycosyltransferase family 2 protein [Desulfitobacteriaceae bacterium]